MPVKQNKSVYSYQESSLSFVDYCKLFSQLLLVVYSVKGSKLNNNKLNQSKIITLIQRVASITINTIFIIQVYGCY